MTTLTPVLGNSQRLDGGAMFGNAPRALWQRWMQPDELNRISLATRSVLIQEDSGRTVLLEAGIGAFFAPNMRERFGVSDPEHVLVNNLAKLGVAPADIDVVVLSHLHFDHAGGLLTAWQADSAPELVFPQAHYVVSQDAWDRALNPTPRDAGSFIPELQPLLEATGRLELVRGKSSVTLGDGYCFHYSDGHTPGLLMTEVDGPDGPVLYTSDLILGAPWVHAPITTGYDRFPELAMQEKLTLLADLVERGVSVVFTHDPEVAIAGIEQDSSGRYRPVLSSPSN
ncbi:MAG: MBL fold metallo-hydrolase [Microthrixaceae bacterium]